MATDTATSTRSARIIDTGKRKYIPGLEITHADGRTEVSKGNRAVKAQYVAFRFHVDSPDEVFATTHARRDLAENYIPTGKKEHAPSWGLVEIVEVQPYTDEDEAPEAAAEPTEVDEDEAPEATPGCGCMTEADPIDPQGPERVLTHSAACPAHPEFDEDLERSRADAEAQRARLVERFRGLGDEEGHEHPAVLAISSRAWGAAGEEATDEVERNLSYARRVSNILAQLQP